MKSINNSSEIYKQMIVSDNTLVSTSDYINDKVNDIYHQILNLAISNYLKDNHDVDIYDMDMKLIKNKDWKVAPKIIFASKKYPFENKTLNIKEYWDDAIKYYKEHGESYSDLMIDEDTLKDAEIININYASGTVKMRSKFTQVEFEVPFSRINGNTNMSTDCTLAGAFTYLANQ